MNEKKKLGIRDQIILTLLLPVAILMIPLIFISWVMTTIISYLGVWLLWNPRGIELLYVYSNSPNWQPHIENEILPRLPERRMVLNWSERKSWKRFTLRTIVFRHFAGEKAFNPIAIVIKPLRRAKIFRFYDAFMDHKHGKSDKLQEVEARFLSEIGAANQAL